MMKTLHGKRVTITVWVEDPKDAKELGSLVREIADSYRENGCSTEVFEEPIIARLLDEETLETEE